MAKAVPLRQALLFWAALIGSGALLYYGGELSNFLISDSHASAWMRWSGVMVGALSILPWVLVIGISLSVMDEFFRRIVLAGTAAAFVLDLVLHIGFNIAMDAQLLSPSSYIPELGAAILTWMLGVGAAFAYYRYQL